MEISDALTAKQFNEYLKAGIIVVGKKGKLKVNQDTPDKMFDIVEKNITIGKRKDLNDQFFRSSWEANYARYLNLLIKHGNIAKWEYEPDEYEFVKIKRGNRYYKPDFKVFYNDGTFEYHEVKGYYDRQSLTKLKRFRKYFPHLQLIMIDEVWFKNNKHLKKIIHFWE